MSISEALMLLALLPLPLILGVAIGRAALTWWWAAAMPASHGWPVTTCCFSSSVQPSSPGLQPRAHGPASGPRG